PAMLIEASRIAAAPSTTGSAPGGPPTVSIPPTTLMPPMAVVTPLSGVCSAGVTFHTTCQPTMQASAKTVRCDRKSGGATKPSASSAAPTTIAPTAILDVRSSASSVFFASVPGAGAAALAGAGGGA